MRSFLQFIALIAVIVAVAYLHCNQFMPSIQLKPEKADEDCARSAPYSAQNEVEPKENTITELFSSEEVRSQEEQNQED